MADPVPATAYSSLRSGTDYQTPSALVIGTTPVPSSASSSGDQGYWYVIVDLSSLEVVANAFSNDNSAVPSEIQPYQGKPGYFLFFIANAMGAYNIPQGDLHTFLTATGAGAGLENAEQVIGQLGTGTVALFTYVLAGTTDTGDLPGFEAFSTHAPSILPMQFVPFESNGQTTYAPSRQTTA